MTDATIYNILTALPEISFIAGTSQELHFTVYDDSGVYSINVGNASWCLSAYGKFLPSDLELVLSDSDLSANTFKIILDPFDTVALSGKYIQQVNVYDDDTREWFTSQGNILILPAVSTS